MFLLIIILRVPNRLVVLQNVRKNYFFFFFENYSTLLKNYYTLGKSENGFSLATVDRGMNEKQKILMKH